MLIDRAAAYFRDLQDHIVAGLERVDGSRFGEDSWTRPGGGGGRSRVLSGKPLLGNRIPYGYTLTADRVRYEINTETAPVVRRIFQECVAGKTTRQIAEATSSTCR